MLNMNKFEKKDVYNIYIGLKDQESYDELDINKFKELLINICHNKQIGFSMVKQIGGYKHKKGYTTETSLRITLLGISENEAEEIGKKLMNKINTDTILITNEECEFYFL